MAFRPGVDSIQREVKAQQEAMAASRNGDRLEFFSIKDDGGTAFLRLLTDADKWLKVKQHNFVQTKSAPADMKDGAKWPKSMSAVCRYDDQIAEMFNDCYVCDNKLESAYPPMKFQQPSMKVWALGVMREQIKGDGTPRLGGPAKLDKPVGMGDVAEAYKILDKDGKPTDQDGFRPKIVMVNMGWQNFFAALAHTYSMNATVCDRDFYIARIGVGRETDYQIMPTDATESLAPGTESWQRYTRELEGRELNLVDLVLKQAGDAHYAKWFDPTKDVDKDGNVIPAGAGSAVPVVSGYTPISDIDSDVDPDAMARLKERLRPGGRVTAS